MDFISASSHLMRTCRNGSIPKKRSIVRLALDTDTHSFITHHSSFIILLKNSAKFCGSIAESQLKKREEREGKGEKERIGKAPSFTGFGQVAHPAAIIPSCVLCSNRCSPTF